MIIPLGTRVTEADSFSPNEPDNIFKTVPSKHSAFVRLKLLHMGIQDERAILPLLRCSEVDETGTLVLNGSLLKGYVRIPGRDSVMHGPAQTTSSLLCREAQYDFVLSLHCETWPESSDEWIHRHRPNTWPTPDLINEVTEQGSELVPVGNPESERRELEWRLSSSLAEKTLVKSLNIVQIQCYFLLKLILAFLIKPYIKDALSSYHMKNIILHVVENTDPREWRADNLTCCFMTCLQTLLYYLEVGYFPQYFILTHNLLHPKIQGDTHQKILAIVRGLYSGGWRCVLRCAPFTNIDLNCGHHMPLCACYTELWRNRSCTEAINQLLFTIHGILFTGNMLLLTGTAGCFSDTLSRILEVLTYNEAVQKPCFPSARAASFVRNILRCHLGYILLYLIGNQRKSGNRKDWKVLRLCQRLLEENCDVDVTSCQLKLATFYYQTGQVYKCIQTVQNVLEHIKTERILPRCNDPFRGRIYRHHPRIIPIMRTLQSLCGNLTLVLGHMAFPVTFSPWEILSAPVAIQELLFARQLLTKFDYQYIDFVFVDPLVYCYFLLTISFLDQGNPAEARKSLGLMKSVVRCPWRHMLYYPETAQQLLQYCVKHYSL